LTATKIFRSPREWFGCKPWARQMRCIELTPMPKGFGHNRRHPMGHVAQRLVVVRVTTCSATSSPSGGMRDSGQ
jgi:hypothetical protein